MQAELRYLKATNEENSKQQFSGGLQVKNLSQAGDEVEPCLVIRAMQPGAVGLLNMAIEVLRDTEYPEESIAELTEIRDAMNEWRRKLGTIAPPKVFTGPTYAKGVVEITAENSTLELVSNSELDEALTEKLDAILHAVKGIGKNNGKRKKGKGR